MATKTISCTQVENSLAHGGSRALQVDAHPGVTLPTIDPYFLQPNLKIIEARGGRTTSPIIIISAPGAVGKTSFARHLSSKKSLHMWDLSRIRLGDNTFIGTIIQCFGSSGLVEIMEDLNRGKTGFVFDAFDEAEILSGWDGVEIFLKDLWGYIKKANAPVAVLLARSETAFLLRTFLDDFADHPNPYTLYEIMYFDKESAKAFADLYVERISKDRGDRDLATRYNRHRQPFHEAVEAVFNAIYKAFGADEDDAWSIKELQSFLGYAPVLQSIAALVASYSNYRDAKERLSEGLLSGENAKIANLIMQELLLREQQKLITSLTQRVDASKLKGWKAWNSLYNPDEQVRRVLQYTLKRGDWMRVESSGLPSLIAEEYSSVLSSFLPQHPFIRDASFSGPAYRDYTIAQMIKSTDEGDRAMARVLMSHSDYVATPLLIYFYCSEERNLTFGEDVGFLYESFMANDSITRLSRAILIMPDDREPRIHRIEMYDEDVDAGNTSEEVTLYIRRHDENSRNSRPAVIFPRKIRNSKIYLHGDLIAGSGSGSFDMLDSEISCRRLTIDADVVNIQSSESGQSVNISAESYEQVQPSMRVRTRGPGSVSISWPGGNQYPWIEYYRQAGRAEDFKDAGNVFHALRHILSWFKRDRREDLARYRDFVDNIVIGDSALKREMRDYLIEREVILSRGRLYVVNLVELSAAGVNWSAIQRGQITVEIGDFIRRFQEWREASITRY